MKVFATVAREKACVLDLKDVSLSIDDWFVANVSVCVQSASCLFTL